MYNLWWGEIVETTWVQPTAGQGEAYNDKLCPAQDDNEINASE